MKIEFSDARIAELEQMARGHRPFVADAILEKLADVPAAEFRRYDPRTRLAVGYFFAAKLTELQKTKGAQ